MKPLFLTFLALSALGSGAYADVSLPSLIADGMVLQRNAPVRIWGNASPGEAVTVTLGKTVRKTAANPDGFWEVTLPKMSAGGPFALSVKGNNELAVKDILIGEVWVCSGQSNMEFTLNGSTNAARDIAESTDPLLRAFNVQKAMASTLKDDVSGRWQSAGPTTAGGFSAVGYYFARKLRKELNVPVGIIHSSWGGTRIEAWMERDANLALGMKPAEYAAQDSSGAASPALRAAWRKQRDLWRAAGSPAGAFGDPGRSPLTIGWERPETDDSGWTTVSQPAEWDATGQPELFGKDGGLWLRRTFQLSAEAASKPATLHLGAIDDTDVTFVNGVLVGSTGSEVPNCWEVKRAYGVPKGILKPGKNSVTVRIWDGQGGGGLTGTPAEVNLEQGASSLSLAGEWRCKAEALRPANPGPEPSGLNANSASVLYNAMLFPLRRYTIQGALWYQGESNAGNAALYRKQLPAMVENWRRAFGNPEAAFYTVQLAPYQKINPVPEDTGWARLREAQRDSMASMKHTGLAVITDVGEEQDIHPKRKGPVGERLALLALKDKYGRKKLAYQGPTFKKLSINGDTATITFDGAFGGLMVAPTDSAGQPMESGKLLGFALAGPDGKFAWGEAKIVGQDRVEVRAPGVTDPKSVRFGWANFPVVNFVNGAGLPATPFQAGEIK